MVEIKKLESSGDKDSKALDLESKVQRVSLDKPSYNKRESQTGSEIMNARTGRNRLGILVPSKIHLNAINVQSPSTFEDSP